MTNTCPICFESISDDKNKLITECKHNFHFSCIIKNIELNPHSANCYSCPICRRSFKSNNKTNKVSLTNTIRRAESNIRRTNVIIRLINQTREQIRQVQDITNNLNQNARLSNNRIIRRNTQPRRNVVRSCNISNSSNRTILKNKISRMTYLEIKEELKKRDLSTRGYKRDTLEKRLYIHMLTNNEN